MNIKVNWNTVLEALKDLLEEKLVKNAPVHDGQLRNSITGKVEGDRLNYYMVDYAIYVNEGTAPHWTSVDNLKKWCKDKWGDENLAYALQKHIATYGCFFGDSHRFKILTDRGYKSLRDVKIGDKVLTQDNKFKKITDKPVYDINDKIPRYTIHTVSGNKVTVTEEHPFYCKRNNKFQWIKAKDLTEKDIIMEVI